ncbi:uncharacterized protein A1O9_06028 [Exophiala aquamarina CBS 119918]|uniref:Major facilitator superfamily (MFS) profile domain-containing protein n=1 Tax=Exophiala aquamarina CBS 119918 TaxID=1182545 RepID=A0A072PRE6_9EURO|nr:uncharacterized protein A1O9_06028 [Exophiala aquamarina CBS 119918]KEF58105.1 hypothetical protein A1O9_06028 [Exophiala aquamarina CBS 119918]
MAWRIPLGMFYVVPNIILSLIWFVPESPRWLLLQGRNDEAEASLYKLLEGPFSEKEIDSQFEEPKYSFEMKQEKGRFSQIFRGNHLKRTLLSSICTIYIKSLGTINAFNFSLILAAVKITACTAYLFMADRVGRKRLLLIGAAVQCAALMTMGGLGTPKPVTYSYKIGIISSLAVMTAGFSLAWAPLTYVVNRASLTHP